MEPSGNNNGKGGWDPMYEYKTSPSSTTKTGRLDTHVLSVCLTVDAYPETHEEARAFVQAYGPHLVQEWVERKLPREDLYYLVHRPGELGPSEAQRIHRADQAEALAREQGGVPVVLAVANIALDPDLVVSKVRFD